MKTFILAAVLLISVSAPWLATRAGAQLSIGDSCFTPNWPYFNGTNPDSILVDTCLPEPCECINPTSIAWIKRGFYINFDTDVIALGWAPSDTDIEVTWQAIDTAYPSLRAEFDSLEFRFGTYTLKKQYPEDTGSTSLGGRAFLLILSNYIPFDSINLALDSISGIQAYFAWPEEPLGVVNLTEGAEQMLTIYPNPARSTLWVHSVSTAGILHFELIDGKGVLVRTITTSANQQDFPINIFDLPSGAYSLKSDNTIIPFIHIK